MLPENERLLKFRADENLTQEALAAKLGVKQQTIAMIENGARPASAAFKLAFLRTFKIDWDSGLNYNKGLFKNVDISDKYLKYASNNNVIPVPLYTAKAAAGVGEILPEYEEKEVLYFDRRWLENKLGVKSNNAALVQATGDSMDSGNNNPDDIKDGDLLLIDSSIKYYIDNKIYVIRLNNSELVVKKVKTHLLGRVELISNNPKYAPRELTEENEAVIIGRVLWNGSKESL